MSPGHVFRVALATLVVATACSEEHPTRSPVADRASTPDLTLAYPRLADHAALYSSVHQMEPPPVPAGIVPSEDPVVPDENATARITRAETKVGFRPTYAYSAGRHSYTGNAGSVETLAEVTLDGQVIGTQPAARGDFVPYLLDWGEIKTIWAEAYVFTDIECGLRVDGDSVHKAWWQWFLAGPVPTWGLVSTTTQAFPPVEQPGCEPSWPDGEGGGGGEFEGGEGGWVSCWYVLTYDPHTGEILEADFLFCDNLEGG